MKDGQIIFHYAIDERQQQFLIVFDELSSISRLYREFECRYHLILL